MNDKDFHAFRKSIEHAREIEFEEKQWEKLARRLDEGDRGGRRRLAGWWALLAALLLPLLLWNAFLFGSLREVKQINEKLMHKLGQFSAMETDTAWMGKVIYVHDTLIKERIVYRSLAAEAELHRWLQGLMPTREAGAPVSGNFPARLRELPGEAGSDNTLDKRIVTVTEDEQARPKMLSAHWNDMLEALEGKEMKGVKRLPGLVSDWSNYATVIEPAERPIPFLLKAKRALQPKGFAAGLATGALFPLPESLQESMGWQAGIGGELIFSEHLRMRGEANFESIELTSESMGASLGIPVISSPHSDFAFSEAKALKNALHFDLGMKYLMKAGSRFQPFVYAGLGTAYILPFDIVYDFEKMGQNGELQVIAHKGGNLIIGGFGMAGLGMSYTLGRRMSLQLEGLYRAQLSNSTQSGPGLATARTILLYSF